MFKFGKNNFKVKQISNKLECVCLLLTGDELDNGLFDRFLNQFNTTSICFDQSILKKINFIILTKNNDVLKKDLSLIKDKFYNFSVVKMDIPHKYDFYLKENCIHQVPNSELYEIEAIEKYGLKAGANFSFFKAFEYLEAFNTTLFLECDCFFGDDWLEKIYNYVQYSGGFWVAGSVYDNEKNKSFYEIANTHLNGGVALYATSNVYFKYFLKKCIDDFPNYLKSRPSLPYDYYIKFYLEKNFDLDVNNRYYWNFVKRQFLICNLIYNYSPLRDSDLDVSSLKQRHDFSILHKK